MALERFDSRISDWHFLQRAEGRGRKIFWGADQTQKFIIIINMLYFYKYPPDIDGAVTLCVYSSLFLRFSNFLHWKNLQPRPPFQQFPMKPYIPSNLFLNHFQVSLLTYCLIGSTWLISSKNHEVSMESRRVNANAFSWEKIISQKTFNQRAWIRNNGGRVSLEKAITTRKRVIWAIYGQCMFIVQETQKDTNACCTYIHCSRK